MGIAQRLVLGALAAALVGGAFASCALAGFAVLDEVPADAGSGAGGASTSSTTSSTGSTTTDAGVGGQGGASCGLATFPGPPSIATTAGQEEFVVAIRSIDFGEASGEVPGLDLDGKCTCVQGAPTPKGCCQSDGPSCKMAKVTCDAPRGIDNAGARVFSLISGALDSFSSAFFSKGAEAGQWTTLFRVRGYNGSANDDQVELDWYASRGIELPAGPDGGPPAPLWDGHDAWYVTTDSVETPEAGPPSLDQPRWFDKNAYVTDHVLVASIPASVLRLAGTSSIDIRISAGFVVARIAPPGDGGAGYALQDGVIVFRWAVKDVFYALSSYRDNDGKPLCTDNVLYGVGLGQICSLPDLTVQPSGPTTPCDALSTGITFQASAAKLGDFFAPQPPSGGCPAGTDPADGQCPPL